MRNRRFLKTIGFILALVFVLEFPGLGLLTRAGIGTYEVSAASASDDWLHTSGGKIVDSEGREVRLTGVNWFGYATGSNGRSIWTTLLKPLLITALTS